LGYYTFTPLHYPVLLTCAVRWFVHCLCGGRCGHCGTRYATSPVPYVGLPVPVFIYRLRFPGYLGCYVCCWITIFWIGTTFHGTTFVCRGGWTFTFRPGFDCDRPALTLLRAITSVHGIYAFHITSHYHLHSRTAVLPALPGCCARYFGITVTAGLVLPLPTTWLVTNVRTFTLTPDGQRDSGGLLHLQHLLLLPLVDGSGHLYPRSVALCYAAFHTTRCCRFTDHHIYIPVYRRYSSQRVRRVLIADINTALRPSPQRGLVFTVNSRPKDACHCASRRK